MAAQPLDVVGSTPISFIDSEGLQRFVPLSALQFNGSALALKPGWDTGNCFTNSDNDILLAIEKAGGADAAPICPLRPTATVAALLAGHPPRERQRCRGLSCMATRARGPPDLSSAN
jgi:hypothetical protein